MIIVVTNCLPLQNLQSRRQETPRTTGRSLSVLSEDLQTKSDHPGFEPLFEFRT